MITTFYPPYHFGGDALFIYHLSKLLAEQGHHVEVIHCLDSFWSMTRTGTQGQDFTQKEVTVHRLRSPMGPISPLATQQTGRPLFKGPMLRRLLQQGFDVIHFHNISLIGGPAILGYGSGIKLYTAHEYWLVCPMHNLFEFNRHVCSRRRCLACSLIHKRPPQWWRYSGLMRRCIERIDALLVPSGFAAKMHESAGIRVPVIHLPGFVPDLRGARFPPAHFPGLDPGLSEPYFLFVGRLERIKGLVQLIRVFLRYGRAKLVIAGKGRERKQCEREAGPCGNILFCGYLPSEPLSVLYRNATALIVPSLVYEVSPLVVLEAFQNGTPVIVRNRGALPEMVEASGAGAVFDREEELPGIMDCLLSDKELRSEWGRRARAEYERNGSPGVHLDRYLALIEGLSTRKAGMR
jgi:glycosyltransferase involved in cell wall biosynthesis